MAWAVGFLNFSKSVNSFKPDPLSGIDVYLKYMLAFVIYSAMRFRLRKPCLSEKPESLEMMNFGQIFRKVDLSCEQTAFQRPCRELMHSEECIASRNITRTALAVRVIRLQRQFALKLALANWWPGLSVFQISQNL